MDVPPRDPRSLDAWPTFLGAAGVALRNAGPLALIASSIIVPTTLFLAFGCPTLLGLMFRPPQAGLPFDVPPNEWLALAGVVLFAAGFGSWTQAAVYVFSDAVLAGESRPGVRAAFGRALERVPSLVLTYLGVIAVTVVGTLFCVLPGIWLSIALIVAPVRSTTAGRTPGRALRESFALTRERWWRVCGYAFLVAIAIQAVYLPLSLPVTLMARFGEPPSIIVMGLLIALSSLLGAFQQVCLVALHRRLEELGPVRAPSPAPAPA